MSAIEITSLTLGELDTNCYLVGCTTTRQAIIIDPADAGEAIVDQVLALQLKPAAILLTHAHFDHVLGSLAVQLSFDIPIYIHPADNKLLAKTQASAEHWLKHPVDPVPSANLRLTDGQIIQFGQTSVRVLHTPGHTPGSCSFLYRAQNSPEAKEHFQFSEDSILFDGDVLFKDAIGSTQHQYSSKKDLYQSLQKIRELGQLRIFPGHGEAFNSSDQPLLN
ncbi:MAG: hypothetical protein COY81_04415 [Candidatus Pacebacteria bacterium CG_4_10_14_0_8_um_filter_43_12]|nr:MAG: hypothetical protein COU66_04130 [Candidatus Pacebacteria bacterium CG10_big_fil_rev_8_21_14_0_10_44_11]PIY79129.1 MAG: hypothetical protein COY81_04415 [Candidatus Pacebacteria bacterium CG_4_10_14_0_8_um_filter_43_12]